MSTLEADYIDRIRLIFFAWFQLYDVWVNNNVPRMVHGQCYICWLAYRVCAKNKMIPKKSGARFQTDLFFSREAQHRTQISGGKQQIRSILTWLIHRTADFH